MPRVVVLVTAIVTAVLAAGVFGIIAHIGLGIDYDTIRLITLVGAGLIGGVIAARSFVKWRQWSHFLIDTEWFCFFWL